MAKKFTPAPVAAKKETKYPSEFGSHESMIDENLTSQLLKTHDDDGYELVICRDDDGPYVTLKNNTKEFNHTLDNNRATSHISVESRMTRVKEALPEGCDLAEKKEEVEANA